MSAGAAAESAEEVELRCPVGPRRLFARIRARGETPLVTSSNLIEMACQDCRRRLGKDAGVKNVLHRYNIAGELIETEVVYHSAAAVED